MNANTNFTLKVDGFHPIEEVYAATPLYASSNLYPDYEASYLGDPSNSLRMAGADNDVLDWTPQAPMGLLQCSGDDGVPYTNTVIAYQTFTNNGACCVDFIDPGAPQALNHNGCFYPSILSAKAWFDSLKE